MQYWAEADHAEQRRQERPAVLLRDGGVSGVERHDLRAREGGWRC